MQSIRNNMIPDHFLFESVPLQELCCERQKSNKWQQFLKINHEITIEIAIRQIIPVFKSREINKNPINFDQLRFHLHHADQSHSSSLVQYHPKHNIFIQGDLIQGKLMKDDRAVKLNIRHEIRHQNIQLYRGIFQTTPIKIVAQASYGHILGIADVYLDDLTNEKILNEYRLISFNTLQFDQNGQTITNQRTLLAKAYISIDSTPIAPLLQDLKLNAQTQIKKRKTSKSKSPNRLISQSPSRAPSPKKKRQLLAQLSSPAQSITHLTIFEGVQYRYSLGSSAVKRQITYRQVNNIKQRKIQLIKTNDEYFVKCYLVKDNPAQRAFLHFQLNQQKFMVYPIPDKVYSIIDYQTYFRAKERKVHLHNKLVRVGNNTLLLPKENTRIIKNFVKQTTIDGILSSVFIKTPFEQCQIYVKPPFILQDIAHKEGGYMLGYYYSTSRPLLQEKQAQLVFYLKSKFKQINQIHVFQCTVSPRIAARDTVFRQLRVTPLQKFYRMSLELMANQNVEYQIRSTSLAISVVNGQNYQFSSQTPEIILQVLTELESGMQFDVVFTDSKLRCFFMKVLVIVENYD